MARVIDGSQDYDFPVVIGSNMQRSAAADSSYAQNWYPFYDEEKQIWAQYFFSGSQRLFNFDVGANPYYGRARGAISVGDTAYCVLGNRVFKLNSILTPIVIGTINTVVGTVSMCIGSKYVMIVDGTAGWAYDIPNDDWQQITDPQFPTAPGWCCEQSGYFIVGNTGTQEVFQNIEVGDPFKWDELTRFQANFKSSYLAYPCVAGESINGRLFIFNKGFIEVYLNEGKVGITFRRDNNLIFGYGLLSLGALVKGTGGSYGDPIPEFLIFVCETPDGNRHIMKTSGEPPRKISTASIDWRLNQLKNPEDCVGFSWTENGQTFVHFNFTLDKVTIVLNVTNKRFFDLRYNGNNRHFTQTFFSFQGKKLMLSYLDSGLYEMSENYLTNSGTPIERIITTDNFRAPGYKNITGNHLELYFQQGVGLPGEIDPNAPHFKNGANPQIFLYISKDGGQTFGEPMEASLGPLADTTFTTRFMALGTQKDWTFRIKTYAPVPVFLMGANFNYTVCPGSG